MTVLTANIWPRRPTPAATEQTRAAGLALRRPVPPLVTAGRAGRGASSWPVCPGFYLPCALATMAAGRASTHLRPTPPARLFRFCLRRKVKKSSLRSNRSVRAEHLLQVAAERLIIVDDQHLLIRVQRPLGNAKGPFRPSRAESRPPDDYRYPGGARGAAAGIEYGADVRANSGRLELLPQLLDMNVEIRRPDNHIFHRLQRSGSSLAHRLPFIGLWHNPLLFCGHSDRNGCLISPPLQRLSSASLRLRASRA